MDAKFFVPFDTARQLKEKGYPQLDNKHHYNLNGDMVTFSGAYEGYTEDALIRIARDFYVAAPTCHEVIDWLIGKGCPLEVFWIKSDSGLLWFCGVGVECRITKNYSSFEEALNAAILKALEML